MKRLSVFLFALVVVALATASADASGLGFYINGGSGDSDIRWNRVYGSGYQNTIDSDASFKSFGLVLDTNLSKQRIFNYRLEIGRGLYSMGTARNGQSPELTQTVVTHDFGIAVVRKKGLRFWVGPELRFSSISDEYDGTYYDIESIGLGLALGLNMNLEDNQTFSLKACAMRQEMSAYYKDAGAPYGYNYRTYDEIYIITMAVIYRFNE